MLSNDVLYEKRHQVDIFSVESTVVQFKTTRQAHQAFSKVALPAPFSQSVFGGVGQEWREGDYEPSSTVTDVIFLFRQSAYLVFMLIGIGTGSQGGASNSDLVAIAKIVDGNIQHSH